MHPPPPTEARDIGAALKRQYRFQPHSRKRLFGANTYRQFVQLLGSSSEESGVGDSWVTRMRSMPATVVSTTLEGSLDWPGEANVVSGNAVDFVARLKEESEVPLRLPRSADARQPHPRAHLPTHPPLTARIPIEADNPLRGSANPT
jgi:hypothetical protein